MGLSGAVDEREHGRRVCLFAQYDPSGTVPPHTLGYLRALLACGFELHVACSGGGGAAAAALGARVYPRANGGLDFGAWRDLLQAGCAQGAAEILFANDSVFGPYGDLRPILERMGRRKLDVWGMVESRERGWHLQSWFVLMSGAALARPAIQRVFAQPFAAMGKEEIILRGELALGVAIRAEGLAAGAVWPSGGGVRRLVPVNPSHFDWRAMLVSGVVPFLKIELVRRNPARLLWARGWRRVVARLPGGDVAAIDALLGQPGRPFVTPLGRVKLTRACLAVLLTRDRWAALWALVRWLPRRLAS